jgi:predicted nucleic-acid-binding protein
MTPKHIILDTNAVLRFIINDNPSKNVEVATLLNKENCIVPVEVIAETVYILGKEYSRSRQRIADEVKGFIAIKENLVVCENVVRFACNTFAATRLDFVDCLLDGYAKVNGSRVFTFDGDLKKRLEHLAYNG